MAYGLELDRRKTRVFSAREKLSLSYERFRRLDLDEVDFSGAILAGSSFDEVSLRGADFSYADLAGARFVRCDLRGAVFDGSSREGLLIVGCVVDETTSLAAGNGRAGTAFPRPRPVWRTSRSKRRRGGPS
jgi:hypothetical protein